jgi:hypothetical protein
LPLRKPGRLSRAKKAGKPKSLCEAPDPDYLRRAANAARYEPSRYHCPGPNGQRPVRRSRPASPCPRDWSVREATEALKRAVNAGYVSEQRNGDFPRYVWYRDELDVFYEARSELRTPDRFHAYPIESIELPRGLRWQPR